MPFGTLPLRSLRFLRLGALAALALLAVGCATVPADAGKNPSDPFERVNRQVDEFNYRVDKYALKPVAKGYQAVVPTPVRNCIANIFNNIGDVPNAINSLLQAKFAESASDACRVVLNTTIGLGGCFDVARSMGLQRSNEDFGQTLGRWGAGPGAYLVLPLLGPSDLRDALGKAVDIELDPLGYVRPIKIVYIAGAVRVVDTRQQLLRATDLVEGAALDRYSFTRDAYLQRRRSLVYDGNPPPLDDDDDSAPPAGPATGAAPAVPAAAPEPAPKAQ